MSNHSMCARLRTGVGAQKEHVRQKLVEHENGDGGSGNVNFEVAVGELQKRGMTVVMDPHGSFVTRGQMMKSSGSNLDLEHSNGAYWMRLIVALVDMGDVVPSSNVSSRQSRIQSTLRGTTQKQTCPRR